MVRPWRVAGSLQVLLGEVNARWPNRDKASDGSIGDARHQGEGWTRSDHNPWIVDSHGIGVVRARDFDSGPGLNPDEAHNQIGDAIADAVIAAAKAGHPAMGADSYVIWKRRIASVRSTPPWSWRPYAGSDPHTSHPHVSVTTLEAGFDSTRPWGLWPLNPKPSAKLPATLWRAKAAASPRKYAADVKRLQKAIGARQDGAWGAETTRLLKAFRKRHGIKQWWVPVAGPKVWALVP